MSDELVSGLLKDPGYRVVLVTAGALTRRARELHGAGSAAAALLGEGLMGAALMASLQKEQARINLQLECDGPLRGFFVDAHPGGALRGYVKNPLVQFVGGSGRYRWRPVLGNKGYLSVLRDLGGGEYSRSSVELERFAFEGDLERYFEVSEQLPTHVRFELVPRGEEPLGSVVGLVVQPLPDADPEAFATFGESLQADLRRAVEGLPAEASASAILKALFSREDLEVMSRYPLAFSCPCSRERVKRALVAMGRAELTDVLEKDGKAEATCEFCTTHYVISAEEIRELLAPSAD